MILGRLLLHYVHRKLTARTVHHSKNPKCDFFTAQLDVVPSNKSKPVSIFQSLCALLTPTEVQHEDG